MFAFIRRADRFTLFAAVGGLAVLSAGAALIAWQLAKGDARRAPWARPRSLIDADAATLSSDGQILAAVTDKRQAADSGKVTAVVWDANTGQRLATLEADLGRDYPGAFSSLALSRDGKLLVTGSIAVLSDRPAPILWDTATGQKLRTFEGHKGGVWSVALSGDGKLLATGGSDDDTAIVWDTATGTKLQTFSCSGDVYCVSLSSDGRFLAAALDVHDVRPSRPSETAAVLWDTGTGEVLQRFPIGSAWSVSLSADGKLLATGSEGGVSILWDTSTGKPLHVFQGSDRKKQERPIKSPEDAVVAMMSSMLAGAISGQSYVSLSRDGKLLATESVHLLPSKDSGKKVDVEFAHDVILWDTATGKKLQTLKSAYASWLRSVSFTPDGKYVWTMGTGYGPRLWSVTTGKELCELIDFNDPSEWVVVTPEGFFDGPEKGAAHMIPDEATRQKFHRPGLLSALLRGERPR
jgi:WD40 repeat protein